MCVCKMKTKTTTAITKAMSTDLETYTEHKGGSSDHNNVTYLARQYILTSPQTNSNHCTISMR